MTDAERLAGWVDVWWQAIEDVTALLDDVPPGLWRLPTDLPGWTVRDVVAHLAHLEAVLAGAPEETIEFEPPAHVTGLMDYYTEQGVVARREHTAAQLLTELRTSATARYGQLLEDPPTNGADHPPHIFGGVPWDWNTLLRNRPLDVWMHEQDIRRAIDRPGGQDSPAARHTVEYLAASLPMVLAKRVAAPVGTTVVLRIAGHAPIGVAVNAQGRGVRLLEVPADPTARIVTDPESFIRLAGGRTPPPPEAVALSGDLDLAERIIAHSAVTP
jgi:uncharacterized protein (TIGR03083 family)